MLRLKLYIIQILWLKTQENIFYEKVLTGRGEKWTPLPVMRILSSSCFPRKKRRMFWVQPLPQSRDLEGEFHLIVEGLKLYWTVGGRDWGLFIDASVLFASCLSNNGGCWKTDYELVSYCCGVVVGEICDICFTQPLWLDDAFVRSVKAQKNQPWSKK